jgi:hypothetical protein
MHRLCIIDNETGVTFEWNGSHTVELRDASGKVFDVMSFGYNDRGLRPHFVEFAGAVETWIADA